MIEQLDLIKTLEDPNFTKTCTICKVEYKNPREHFLKQKTGRNGLISHCKYCKRKLDFDYANTEIGYLSNAYNNMCKRINSKRAKRLPKEERERYYKCSITREEFFELWEEHKRKRGYRCHITGVEMICKRAIKTKGFNGYLNGMSVDRLDSRVGYTKENIIFVTNEINKQKGSITKQVCESILKIFKEKNL